MSTYMITNGSWYLRRDKKGNWIPTEKMSEAKFYEDLPSAEKQMRAIPNILKSRGYYVSPCDLPQPQDLEAPDVQIKNAGIDIGSAPSLFDSEFEDVRSIMQELCGMAHAMSYLNDILSYCSQRQSEMDLEQEDLLHKIEFETGNCSAGWKLFDSLRTVRKRRRTYKDIITIVRDLMGYVSKDLPKDYMESKQRQFQDRKYIPRSSGVFSFVKEVV